MKKLTPEKPEHILFAEKVQLDTRNRTLIFENEKIIDIRPMEFVILQKLILNLNERRTQLNSDQRRNFYSYMGRKHRTL